jgi:ATP-dependent Lon protease
MLTALASAFTKTPVKPFLAMTGEITLRGKVLPVGGIKEKMLAAKRAGLREVVLCRENEKHVQEIEREYIHGLTFHYVDRMDEVLRVALGIGNKAAAEQAARKTPANGLGPKSPRRRNVPTAPQIAQN